ncbi:MAG: SEC-C domain-containing protein [Clostridiales bacterium]|nr:SEC-C domain-containing protein [Clostridiales bacterium]
MRSVGQHDPVVEYKREGSEMFEEMNEAIQNDAVQMLMKANFTPEKRIVNKAAAEVKEARKADAAPMKAEQVEGAANNSAPSQPIRRAAGTVGRNDPCPCGSGKKYKNCCGKNE